MSRFLVRWVAAVGLAGLIVAVAGGLLRSPPTVEAQESECQIATGMTAQPEEVVVGDEVSVTAHFSATCTLAPRPMHMVLVLDNSLLGDFESRRDYGRRVVEGLDLASHPHVKVGIVKFSSRTTTLCALTNESEELLRCIGEIDRPDAGSLRIDLGIEEGMKVLLRGRSSVVDRELVAEAMLLVSAGQNTAGCPPVLQTADGAKRQKVLMMTACAGDKCDDACLRQAASSPRHFFRAEDPNFSIQAVLEDLRSLTPDARLGGASVQDTVPEGVAMLRDSFRPEVSFGEDHWRWSVDEFPVGPVTLTYRVRPLETGRLSVSSGALLTGLAPGGSVYTATFPVPEVLVLPRPTATPTPTATPEPSRMLYLPALHNDE